MVLFSCKGGANLNKKTLRLLKTKILPALGLILLFFLSRAMNGGDAQQANADPQSPSSSSHAYSSSSKGSSHKSGSSKNSASRSKNEEKAREIASDYNLTDKEFEKHIVERHGADSTDPSKSKFYADFDIRQGIDDALTDDDSVVRENTGGRDGYIFEKTYDDPIGTNDDGSKVHTIRVVMGEDGFVVTAFPVK